MRSSFHIETKKVFISMVLVVSLVPLVFKSINVWSGLAFKVDTHSTQRHLL